MTVEASGTKTLSEGSFVDLGTVTGGKDIVLTVNLENFAPGEKLQIKRSQKLLTTDAEVEYETLTFSKEVLATDILELLPVHSEHSVTFAAKQIGGANHDMKWSMDSI